MRRRDIGSRRKEMKENVGELEKQLKQKKGADSLGSVNFCDLSIHRGLFSIEVQMSRL